MNFIHKFIIPLLDSRITLDDISEDVGFCGMATYDPNRPYLDNHIFLIYSMEMTNKAIAVRKKLASLDIHNKIDCRIQGNPYRVFCFPIIGKSILNLMSNVISLSENELLQVYKFWNFNDSEINKYMVNNMYIPEFFKELKVPEFDYSPKDFIKFDEKGWTLDYQCSPFIFVFCYSQDHFRQNHLEELRDELLETLLLPDLPELDELVEFSSLSGFADINPVGATLFI